MKSHCYQYIARKKNFGIAARDCYEKVVNFEHEGVIYKYSASIKDDNHP